MDWLLSQIEKIDDLLKMMPDWLIDYFGGTNIVDLLINNSIQILVVPVLGWVIATLLERSHVKNLQKKEQELIGISLSTSKRVTSISANKSQLLIGSTVISHDYFRGFFIFIKKIIGGNISAYERLLKRGRREALIRLKEQARSNGFNKVINVRFNSAKVAEHVTAIEVFAYGTGIFVNNNE